MPINNRFLFSMWINLLAIETSDISPKSKYFLIALLNKYGSDKVIDNKVKSFADDLGVSDRVVTKSMHELVLKDYLSVGIRRRDRGRPGAVYKWLPKIGCVLGQLSAMQLPITHERLIRDLFGDIARPAKHQIKVTNRLLLAVLLCKSDVCGAVRGVSTSELSKLTGMSKDMLRSQLRALKVAGYIRSSVQGGIGICLFGMAKGAYFLNLKHCSFGRVAKPGITAILPIVLTHENSNLEGRRIFSLAGAIQEELKRLAIRKNKNVAGELDAYLCNSDNGLLNELQSFITIVELFRCDRKASDSFYLQMKIEEYASFLLSKRWADLANIDKDGDRQLIDKIESDIYISNAKISNQQKITLFEFIHHVSLRMALRVQNEIKLVQSVQWESMTFLILPCRKLSIPAVECFSNEGERVSGYLIFCNEHDSANKYKWVGDGDIRTDTKYFYGLLTDPKS